MSLKNSPLPPPVVFGKIPSTMINNNGPNVWQGELGFFFPDHLFFYENTEIFLHTPHDGTYPLVGERFGEGQPPFDGHDEGDHATGLDREEPQQDAEPARPHGGLGARPVLVDEQQDEQSVERDHVADDQAAQHERVFAVAVGPGPVEHVQRQQTAQHADGVWHGERDAQQHDVLGGQHWRHHRRRRRHHRGHVRRDQFHRVAIVFCGGTGAMVTTTTMFAFARADPFPRATVRTTGRHSRACDRQVR